MESDEVVVTGWRYDSKELELNYANAFKLAAIAHRLCGPLQLMVAGANRDRRLLGLVHCSITDEPDLGLGYCVDTLEQKCNGPTAILVYSDEQICPRMTSMELALCFFRRRAAAADLGVHLIDWMICDGKSVLSLKYTVLENPTWWDLPLREAT